MEIIGVNVETAYYRAIESVLDYGKLVEGQSSLHSVGKDRKTIEVRNLMISIENPLDRIVQSEQRKINLKFPFGCFVWTLFGRNDVEFMKYYNAHAPSFSEDGITLPGAYGPRILSGLDQAVTILREDSLSRRAVVHIHNNDDL